MNGRASLIAVLLCAFFGVPGEGQTAVADLRSELDSGRVELVSAEGNGSSSGAAVQAVLRNLTSSIRRIRVSLDVPIRLRNRGAGQNMVAVEVYLEDGGYLSDGRQSFIELRPGARTPVFFVAYCLDFDKDNPTDSDQLVVDFAPTGLEPVLRRIAAHARRNPHADLTAAGQAAVWLAQGVTMDQIREKFEVSASEERLARAFAQ